MGFEELLVAYRPDGATAKFGLERQPDETLRSRIVYSGSASFQLSVPCKRANVILLNDPREAMERIGESIRRSKS
jgi:hypothetical protein